MTMHQHSRIDYPTETSIATMWGPLGTTLTMAYGNQLLVILITNSSPRHDLKLSTSFFNSTNNGAIMAISTNDCAISLHQFTYVFEYDSRSVEVHLVIDNTDITSQVYPIADARTLYLKLVDHGFKPTTNY